MKSAQRCSVIADPSIPSGVQENNYLFPKSEASSDEDALILGVKHWWSQIRESGGIGQGVTFTHYNVGKPIAWFTRMAWQLLRVLAVPWLHATPTGLLYVTTHLEVTSSTSIST
ncbi:hypothetical protein TELCIR_13753 [Teladorsagia circumcincta]|uniref:SCP domain-containing protein n=1 Tax=Teladorsagia circumcincta TaxID=45464 RepID=A0A2G9U357_TELCI|nr:hypothetical protein TELCIR_13753 [Teladorsagia circumcincta]